MNNEELINVLWVEDDPKIIETYPLDAERYGLSLVHFPCWDEAKAALQRDYTHYSAIILDAKCKHHRDSKDDAIVFLGHALSDIKELAKEKGEVIPWYVLSGAAEDDFTRSILEDRLKWDEDWTQSTNKVYYAKGVDNEMLYQRVRVHAERYNKLFQIHHIYKDVFDAMKECEISDEAVEKLEKLLIPIHFPNIADETNYNNMYMSVRIISENVIRSMGKFGILPKFEGDVNLRGSISFLGLGLNKDNRAFVMIKNSKGVDSKYERTTDHSILPKILYLRMMEMSNAVAKGPAHSGNNDEIGETDKYLQSVGNSTYLLKSYALNLCDLILWYWYYLRGHRDFNKNTYNWRLIE